METHEIEHKRKLLENYRLRMYKLEETAALYGSETPTHIEIEIDLLKGRMLEVEAELKRLPAAPAVGSARATPAPHVSGDASTIPLPRGWVLINEDFLSRYRSDL